LNFSITYNFFSKIKSSQNYLYKTNDISSATIQ